MGTLQRLDYARQRCAAFTRSELLIVAVLIVVIVLLFFSSINVNIGNNRELANRAVCAENVRSLVQSMIIYAQDNHNEFPAALGPTGGTYANKPDITSLDTAATPKAAAAMAFGTGMMAESPLASMWLLALNGQMAVKSFICPSDPYATQPSDLYSTSNRYFDNFGVVNGATSSTGIGESYSIDFPWRYRTGTIGGWWLNKGIANLPLAADMAPAYDLKGGEVARNPLLPLKNTYGTYIFNSGNHAGDGQNVGFGDGHVVWENNPYVGENSDSMYSYGNSSSTSPTDGARYCGSTGSLAAYHSWNPGQAKSWDVWMAPVRDVCNGNW